jgi:hypothetical protein
VAEGGRARGGFLRLDPSKIPPSALRQAASLSGSARFGERVPLEAMPVLRELRDRRSR